MNTGAVKYNIFTEIEGVKQYVRRIRRTTATRVAVTMVCQSKTKAFDFGTLEKATDFLRNIGIGYAIETNK